MDASDRAESANVPDEPASYQLKKFTEAAEKIRSNAGSGAKALGAVGAAGVGAVGVVSLGDVFPITASFLGVALVIGVVLGILAMAAAVLWLTIVTWRVGDPVFTSNDPDKMDPDARDIARRIYNEVNGGRGNLHDWQDRVNRMEKEAGEPGKTEKQRQELQARASAIRQQIRATQARVVALVVRERSKRARRPRVAFGTALLFTGGLVLSGLSGDALDALRTKAEDSARTAKACAEAVGSLTANNMTLDVLDPECVVPTSSTKKPSVVPARRGQTLEALLREYRGCVAVHGDERCEWIVDLAGL